MKRKAAERNNRRENRPNIRENRLPDRSEGGLYFSTDEK
jgi:hypothetical protein